jgi:transketolase
MTTAQSETRTIEDLSVDTIRTLSMDAVQKANSGHPGTPMALAPLAYVLYTRVMRHNPSNADWFDRDRFVLSAGHASMLLYSMLYLSGYGLTLDDLKGFRQLGSPTAGHPEYEYEEAPGIEATTGPLGQGFGMSVGLALAEAMLAERFNRSGHELIDHHTYVIASDGDIQEGLSSEASSLAGHLGLGKLTVFFDDNRIQLSGKTDVTFSEDVAKRYEAYGWHVLDVGEDMALDTLTAAAEAAKAVADRPSLVIVRSHIGYGSPNLQDTSKAHGSPLGDEEVKLTKQAYGWPEDRDFYVPDGVLEHFSTVAEHGRQAEEDWEARAARYREAHPDLWAELELVMDRRLPDGWDADVPSFQPDDGPMATRKASGQVIQWAAKQVPQLVAGSADLDPSTLTVIEDGGDVQRDHLRGRNVHYGVREHAMGAIVNGLNLHGMRAYGATFFNFLDYLKPTVRLSALMHLSSIFVFTHDSIGLGEDGPTHQPVEQLAILRAQPNTCAVRPADANETARAWQFAINRAEGPTALVLSRQSLPVLDPGAVPADAIERGAYVLREASTGDRPQLILIGTGSEVSVCLAAAQLLEADGIATRVVSAPCLDAFATQDAAYRDSVLPPACRARVSVEAASPLGWSSWTGTDGDEVAMTTFGRSAPQPDLYEFFGFTPEKVAERARAVLARVRDTTGEETR